MIRVARQAEADFRRVLMSADAASLCASEQVGKPLDLYYAPANLFVAGFIGSPAMNFFAARVESVEAGHARVAGAGFRSLDLPATSLSVGDALTVGVRPEHLARETNGPFAAEGVVERRAGPAVIAERLGATHRLFRRAIGSGHP
jgi:ABC-type sugar transport system ATPase subunit